MSKANLEQMLQREKELLSEYLQLSRAQQGLIEEEEMQALVENLEQRAQLLSQAEALRPQIQAMLNTAEAKNTLITDLRKQISRILQEVTEIDIKNQKAVQDQMGFFQKEIKRVNDTRKGASAYIKGAETFTSAHFDAQQ